tara:strand:+ start:93 stop:443 length:351 start_codon:yes stop_codon:yes gene_type:complete
MTVDLSDLGNLKFVLIAALFAISAYSLIWPSLKELFKGLKGLKVPSITDFEHKRKGVDRSSDTPPPKGFAEHLQIIEDTAPNANTQVWWDYAKQELTEAEVAIAEAKLARKHSSID